MRLNLAKIPQVFFYLTLFLVCLPAISTLFPSGYFYTHDGAYHLIRFFHFYNELQRGQFPVRWANDLAFGYGYPVFNYFYPLLYYLGSLIHSLGFSFEDSLKIILAFSTIFSAWAMYWWLKGHFRTLPSLIGAIIYVYTPFRFSMMYINGHFGAVLELFIVPLILASVNRILEKREYRLLPILSVLFAMYLTAHNFSALFFLPILAGYSLILILAHKISLKQICFLFSSFILGIGLAAFFIFPAVFELKFIQLSIGNPFNYQDHWTTLSQIIYSKWGYGYSGKGVLSGQSTQLGLAQQLVFIVGLIGIFFSFRFFKKLDLGVKKFNELTITIFMVIITLFYIFLILEPSNFIWLRVKVLQEIQFPWRLLSVPMLTIPFIAGWVLQKWQKIWIILPIIFILFLNNRNYLRTWETKRYTLADYQKNLYQFYGSTDVAWEARPIWVKNIPNSNTGTKILASQDIKVTDLAHSKFEERKFLAETENPANITLNYFYFPSWKVLIDGKEVKISPVENDGTILFSLSPGKHIVTLVMGSTNLENISNTISLISLIIVLAEMIYLLSKPMFPK